MKQIISRFFIVSSVCVTRACICACRMLSSGNRILVLTFLVRDMTKVCWSTRRTSLKICSLNNAQGGVICLFLIEVYLSLCLGSKESEVGIREFISGLAGKSRQKGSSVVSRKEIQYKLQSLLFRKYQIYLEKKNWSRQLLMGTKYMYL